MSPLKAAQDAPPKYDRRSASREVAGDALTKASKRRTTRDGRQPLVVYLQRDSIKALKIAALETDTTASAIVAAAVAAWLRKHAKRKATTPVVSW